MIVFVREMIQTVTPPLTRDGWERLQQTPGSLVAKENWDRKWNPHAPLCLVFAQQQSTSKKESSEQHSQLAFEKILGP